MEDPTNVLFKIEAMIKQSGMSAKDGDSLFTALSFADEDDLKILLELCLADKEFILKVSGLYQSKLEALRNNNQEQWNSLINEEEKYLNSVK